MKKSLLLLAATLSVSSLALAGSLQSLNKSQVTNEFQDKTITTISLVTINDKLEQNAFTGYFNKNGQLNGQFANKPENDPQNDQGKWTVKTDGTLCATWDHWNKGNPICVSVYKLKNGYLFVNQGNKKIETVILDENIKSGNQLS